MCMMAQAVATGRASRLVACGAAFSLAACAGVAHGAIAIVSGTVDAITSGTVGRGASTSGNNVDDPAVESGTYGVMLLNASSSGGPLAPGSLPNQPGTTASHQESAQVYQFIEGNGVEFMRITQSALVSANLLDLDGPGIVANSSASVITRTRFTISQPTPYRISGFNALDNEDGLGGMRLTNSIGQIVFIRTLGDIGSFDVSGTLNAGTYILQTSANVAAVAGEGEVSVLGDFSERGETTATLLLGSVPACDGIDFNNDGLFPDDNDLLDFLSILAGGPCSTGNACNDIDFNNDGLLPDDNDLLAFLRVLAGGEC